MARKTAIAATYDYMDAYWRASLGPHADITCALFDGADTKSLEQAQADKHAYILSALGVAPGHRVLDIGCGWGGFLWALSRRGGQGVGLTLSAPQARACRRGGLDVRLLDWREADIECLGSFDGLACVGAFEHFCSEADHLAGIQEQRYREFFAWCHRLLRPGGRLYLQTMTWGLAVPDPARITLSAPKVRWVSPGGGSQVLSRVLAAGRVGANHGVRGALVRAHLGQERPPRLHSDVCGVGPATAAAIRSAALGCRPDDPVFLPRSRFPVSP